MTKEQIQKSVGKTILSSFSGKAKMVRIVAAGKTFCVIDMPEMRSYYTSGRLMPMPQKKIYYKTLNHSVNIRALLKIVENYVFKLQSFENKGSVRICNGDPEKNILPDIKVRK